MKINNRITIKNYIRFCAKNSLYFKDEIAIKSYLDSLNSDNNELELIELIIKKYIARKVDKCGRESSISINNYTVKNLERYKRFCKENKVDIHYQKTMNMYLSYLEKYITNEVEDE